MKTYLASEVKKLDFSTLYTGFIKSSFVDLTHFLLFLPLLLTILLL